MYNIINNWWEKICNNCGKCCYEKEFNGDIIFVNINTTCENLELCSNRCNIYMDRFKLNKDCRKVTIFTALFNPYLPGDCGYVQKFRFWRKKRNDGKNCSFGKGSE